MTQNYNLQQVEGCVNYKTYLRKNVMLRSSDKKTGNKSCWTNWWPHSFINNYKTVLQKWTSCVSQNIISYIRHFWGGGLTHCSYILQKYLKNLHQIIFQISKNDVWMSLKKYIFEMFRACRIDNGAQPSLKLP